MNTSKYKCDKCNILLPKNAKFWSSKARNILICNACIKLMPKRARGFGDSESEGGGGEFSPKKNIMEYLGYNFVDYKQPISSYLKNGFLHIRYPLELDWHKIKITGQDAVQKLLPNNSPIAQRMFELDKTRLELQVASSAKINFEKCSKCNTDTGEFFTTTKGWSKKYDNVLCNTCVKNTNKTKLLEYFGFEKVG